MTIYELDDILALKDWDKICSELEKQGFRRAGEIGEHEFKPNILQEQSAYSKSAIQRDDPADKEYYATLYQDNKTYKGLTFISLMLWVIMRDKGNISVPKISLLFTDAPYDDAYIKRINSTYKCDLCGDEYIKKELSEHDDEFLCDDCMAKTIEEEYYTYCLEMMLKKLSKRNGKHGRSDSMSMEAE